MRAVGGLERLWGAVLNQAINDALSVKPSKYGYSAQASELDQYKARQWFGGRDFRMVCALAGFDPDWLLPRIPLDGTPEERREFLVRLRGDIRVGRRRARVVGGAQGGKSVRICAGSQNSLEPVSGRLMRSTGNVPEPAL